MTLEVGSGEMILINVFAKKPFFLKATHLLLSADKEIGGKEKRRNLELRQKKKIKKRKPSEFQQRQGNSEPMVEEYQVVPVCRAERCRNLDRRGFGHMETCLPDYDIGQ